MLMWLRRVLTRRRITVVEPPSSRRVRVREEPPSDRFVYSIALMIVFFVGLLTLQVAHMLILDRWNDAVWMLINTLVGAIIGAIWGYREA